MNHRATPAISRWAKASSHSSFAALRHCCDRLSAHNSSSCSDFVEHSKRYSNGGMGLFTGQGLQARYGHVFYQHMTGV